MQATMPRKKGDVSDEDVDDDELPSDLDVADDSSVEGSLIELGDDISLAEGSGDEWAGIGSSDKRKRDDKSRTMRKKRKALPTFATYEEYAKMIEEGPEDDI